MERERGINNSLDGLCVEYAWTKGGAAKLMRIKLCEADEVQL